MSLPDLRRRHHLAALATSLVTHQAVAGRSDGQHGRIALRLGAWIEPDGAMPIIPAGDNLDPYFSCKGLIVADMLGLDIQASAQAWLRWLLNSEQRDGSFRRWCRSRQPPWTACAASDADDAMAAVWIELICRCLKQRNAFRDLQPALMASLRRSKAMLDRLREPRGTYSISATLREQLLMDNCEIFAALQLAGKTQGLPDDVRHWARQQAERLPAAILQQFWDPQRRHFRPSSQPGDSTSFYPAATAQLFPALCGLQAQRDWPSLDWAAWISRYGKPWLNGAADPYPWGLVAVACHHHGAHAWARDWLERSRAQVGSGRWHILEECISQGLRKVYGA